MGKPVASVVRNPAAEAPVLLTPRLRLRPHTAADFEALARMWADPDVVRHITGRPSTATESWARLLRYVGHWRVLGFGYWALEDLETGAFVGEAGFADYRREIEPSLDGVPEAGWVLAPQAQGRGLATEAMQAAIAWGDANFTSDVTACLFDPQHKASIRVAAKCGYVEKGRATLAGLPTLVMERTRGA